MADLRRVYIDTCCFIDIVKVEIGKSLDQDRENNVWTVKRLLEANRDNEVEVYTSTLTIAECRHDGDGGAPPEVQALLTRLLLSGQYVRLIQMTPFVAQDARDLTWKHGLHLKGADSIHVASALELKCEELLSTNGRLKRLGTHQGEFAKLGLRVLEGRDTTCLPAKYRQLELGNGDLH